MIGPLLSPFLSACLVSNNHPSVDFFQKRKPTKLSQCKLQIQVFVLRVKAFFYKNKIIIIKKIKIKEEEEDSSLVYQ